MKRNFKNLTIKEALEHKDIPQEVKDRLKTMEKGVFKSTSSLISLLEKSSAGPITLEKPTVEQVKAWAKEKNIAFTESDMDKVEVYIASTETTDFDGDIVRQKFNLNVFNANPAMPFSHDWGGLAIGGHLNAEVKQIDSKQYKGPALVVTSLFIGGERNTFAGEVHHQVKNGFLKGISIGFEPTKVTFVEDEEERKQLGLGRWGILIEESKLLECSPCLLPNNPLALNATAKSMTLDFAKSLVDMQAKHHLDGKDWSEEKQIYYAFSEALKKSMPEHKEEINTPESSELSDLKNLVGTLLQKIEDITKDIIELKKVKTAEKTVPTNMVELFAEALSQKP